MAKRTRNASHPPNKSDKSAGGDAKITFSFFGFTISVPIPTYRWTYVRNRVGVLVRWILARPYLKWPCIAAIVILIGWHFFASPWVSRLDLRRRLDAEAHRIDMGLAHEARLGLKDLEKDARQRGFYLEEVRAIRLQGDCYCSTCETVDARDSYDNVICRLKERGGLQDLRWPNPLDEATHVFEAIRSNELRKELAHAVRGLAQLAYLEGQPNQALAWFDRADSFFGNLNPPDLEGKARVNLGRIELFRSNGNLPDAWSAVKAVRLPADASAALRARVELALGRLAYSEMEHREAATHYEEALRILTDLRDDVPLEQILRKVSDMPVNPLAVRILAHLVDARIMAGDDADIESWPAYIAEYVPPEADPLGRLYLLIVRSKLLTMRIAPPREPTEQQKDKFDRATEVLRNALKAIVNADKGPMRVGYVAGKIQFGYAYLCSAILEYNEDGDEKAYKDLADQAFQALMDAADLLKQDKPWPERDTLKEECERCQHDLDRFYEATGLERPTP